MVVLPTVSELIVAELFHQTAEVLTKVHPPLPFDLQKLGCPARASDTPILIFFGPVKL